MSCCRNCGRDREDDICIGGFYCANCRCNLDSNCHFQGSLQHEHKKFEKEWKKKPLLYRIKQTLGIGSYKSFDTPTSDFEKRLLARKRYFERNYD